MGVTRATKIFGLSKAVADLLVDLMGKSLALEAYGFLHQLVRQTFRGSRAKELADHLHGSAPELSVEGLAQIVEAFVHEMVEMQKLFPDGFLVVFEGPQFAGKSAKSAERLAKQKKAYDSQNYKDSINIPDCLVRLILCELTKVGVKWLIPPAEADAQLAHLKVCVLF